MKPLRILDLFITEYCNLSCVYCSSNNNIKTFISLDELKNMDYDKYTVINILGGEPLLHPEILDILKYYSSEKFKDKTVILYTNGTMLPKLNIKEKYNINVLLTFHSFGDEVQEIYTSTIENIFYKNIRYQMLYTLGTFKQLKEFNSNELASKIFIGFDIDLDTDIKYLVKIKKYLNNFDLYPVNLLFQKKEENIVRNTDLVLYSVSREAKTEYHEGFQFCLLKYHFEWDKN